MVILCATQEKKRESEMDSRERVLTALKGGVPDKVPFMFGYVDEAIREALLGEKPVYECKRTKADWAPTFTPEEKCFLEPYECTDARIARLLGLDAIGMQYMTPVIASVNQNDAGIVYIKESLLTSREALAKVKKNMPDVDDEGLYRPAERFIERYKGEFALYCRIRLGISPTLMSMGTEEFSYNIYDEPEFLKEVIDLFTGWVAKHIKNLMECGFDFIWSFDDMAFKANPLFSNDVLREFFLPRLKKAADCITVPWVFHSDGNLLPALDDLLTLGMSGLHPLEPGAMDLQVLKEKYGKKLCLIGNVDIDHAMIDATPEEIDAIVKSKMDILGPGGGYIISDSNSVPKGVTPENIIEIAKCVEKYRYIY